MDESAAEPIDPWTGLGARYRHDSHAQFVLFVEQFAVARELLLSPELSKHRMALVAVDNLAELVLYRHKRRLAKAAQESWRDIAPRLDRKDEQRFRGKFNVRVDLGLEGAGPGLLETTIEPVVDRLDAALFRVGHRYRNRVYHADHHNPAALELVARAYYSAVGRAFVRLQPRNIASSMNRTTRDVLRAYGYSGSADSWASGAETFAPAEAAEAITGHLHVDLGAVAAVKDVLVRDAVRRVEWTRQMIKDLLADGMPEDRLEFGLRWTFLWRDIALDPEVVELERRMRAEWHRRADDPEAREGSLNRDAELNEQRNMRVKALLSARRQDNFDLPGRLEQIRRSLEQLRRARQLATAVQRYERLDTAMEEIEEILDEAATGWDRWVQHEIDRRRGK